ncbi:leucine-rich repeat and calponin homology domain-containing protein 1-like isoform X2 [Trichogramma pretiosum]|uniref:leucine-rich repeat and calponin homology domain-containing protein 1-like isoform X2 n=1 Tax=Trichogramma pretiosum TaxID=7493 RepID=UPI0006C9497F|nr:leucine-rich repeat and calponin homology domain-containing protein 1-like isoform X2 [Trichogramma pretiosum]
MFSWEIPKICFVNCYKITIIKMSEVQKQITRNLQRTLEDAHISGELKLGSRKLKEFPKNNCSSTKLNLQDLVFADLSKNRLIELPEEITEFVFLEKLYLNQNAIKCIPETVLSLQSLSYLDISRNQLLTLPKEICHLPLQTLIVSYNRLSSLPEDLNLITTLAELDAGHNELRNLPYRIGDISTLKYLDLRKNYLVNLPIELMSLKLWKLDISGNRISVLPNELRKMTSLVSFKVHDNPLTSPPAALCVRGQIHIFKYLERQAEKYERLKSVKGRNNDFTETRHQNDSQSLLHWPHIDCENVGKTYPEEDNSTMRFVQNIPHKKQLERSRSENGEKFENPHCSSDHTSFHVQSYPNQNVLADSCDGVKGVGSKSPFHAANSLSSIDTNDKKGSTHIQTYREYKEALRLQRVSEASNIYRSRDLSSVSSQLHPCDNIDGENDFTKKIYKKPKSPSPSCHTFSENDSSESHDRLDETSKKLNVDNLKKSSFTIKREHERAKEEAELIEKLRHDIESRLKINLSEDLASALMDGVILCHLANFIKPRSIASIHVPSAAVPKLSMARCRRNVDNFLDACRKNGVNEELMMDTDAIMDIGYMNNSGLEALALLISNLVITSDVPINQERICATIQESFLSTVLLLGFIISLILLYFFPVPA